MGVNKEKLQITQLLVDGKPVDFDGYIFSEYVPGTDALGLLSDYHIIVYNQKTDKPQYTIEMSATSGFSKQNESGEMIGKDRAGNQVGHCVLPSVGAGICGIVFSENGKQIVAYFNTNKKIK